MHPFHDVVVLDTETTGFGRSARLVEVAALHVRDGDVIDQFETLVNPSVAIPWQATRVHGITDTLVRGAPSTRTALEALFRFVGARPMVAHNARFDGLVLSEELARWALPRGNRPMYCTMALAREVFPGAPNHQLSTLVEHLRLGVVPSHRAFADAVAAAGVLRACVERASAHALGRVAPPMKL